MSEKYKLVPVEPTQEMIDAGRTARTHPAERYKAMLAVAPEAQGEPVDELRFEYRHTKTGETYTVSLSREEVAEQMEQELFDKLTACFCGCEPVGETYVVDCCCDEYADQFEMMTAPQPAPDVAELLEALTPRVIDWMRCGLAVNGHLQDGDHPALAKLNAAIAAYRKQEASHDNQ